MQVNNDSLVYVLCPPYLKTGGTELIHQLVYTLNKLGINCNVVYTISVTEQYLNPAFSEYVKEYLVETDIKDVASNILIVPETLTHYIGRYKNINIYLWWLSVDNYIKKNVKDINRLGKCLSKEYGHIRVLLEILSRFIKKKHRTSRALPLEKMSNVRLHMVQSYYAFDFLKNEGFNNIKFLSDYVNDIYIEQGLEVSLENKEDIVVYNPKKGKSFTRKIMKACKDIAFVPLINMTNEQIMLNLRKAKVYIDFGGHPGKDRFPREAAMMQCCIITGMRGSAGYPDVLIPSEFKFADKEENIDNIAKCIRSMVNNYEQYIDKYSEYRIMIQNEKQSFEDSCCEIFGSDFYRTYAEVVETKR